MFFGMGPFGWMGYAYRGWFPYGFRSYGFPWFGGYRWPGAYAPPVPAYAYSPAAQYPAYW